MAGSDESAEQYAERTLVGFASKAGHNKRESLACFALSILSTLLTSVFIAFGEGQVWGKIVPFCLALFASGLSTWLQFRKPHQLWAIYRSAQRQIEYHITKHRFRIDGYGKTEQPDRLLAKNTAEIAIAAHDMWVPLIPSPEKLEALQEKTGSSKLLPTGAIAKDGGNETT